MWHRGFARRFGFGPFEFAFDYGPGPFGFFFHRPRRFARREAYLRWLEEYRSELEEELKAVDEEIRELRRSAPVEEA